MKKDTLWYWLPLGIYALFSLIAIIGFATFGLNPGLLASLPGLAGFYSIAYQFFGQAHVLLGAAVLLHYMYRFSGFAWGWAFLAVYALSLGSELAGTSWGIPFGEYEYTHLMGSRWFGEVPLLIPLSWFLMAVPSYVLANHVHPGRNQRVRRILFAAVILTLWDLALDPAMSALTPYWLWESTGPYYGMPWLNLFGWVGTGVVLMATMEVLGAREWTIPYSARWMIAYYAVTVAMSLGMLLAAGFWLAVFVTIGAYLAAWIYARGARSSAGDDPPHFRALGRRVPPQAEVSKPVTYDGSLRELDSTDLFRFFRRNSRSFSFASRWFSDEQRHVITCLYAFCRTVDDVADAPESDPEQVRRELSAWMDRARKAYHGESAGIPWLDDLMARTAASGAPLSLVEDLITGVESDLGPVRVQSWEELDLYTYRVASVVGIWICYLFGVRDRDLHASAAALGRAMQLTNIVRDIGEDLSHDRIYLPRDMMAAHDVTEEHLREMSDGGTITPEYRALIEEIMTRAEKYYDTALPALAHVPPSFARASAVAAHVYRGIHAEVRRAGYDNLNRRAFTSTGRKVLLSVKALLDLGLARIRTHTRPAPSIKPLARYPQANEARPQ